ncbi:MAG TPA: hypothetical protein VJ885_14315 [Thermoanaerobaculia bacterium]|jgi:hypothetical protein|nr:hypothetical protein [Thermoanaerobaculia bacterium]
MTLLARVSSVLQREGVPHALIGAGALTIHGVNRATVDLDLLVLDTECLQSTFWTDLESQGASVEIRKGDLTDPLAGVVRFRASGQRPVDLVVGKYIWQRRVLERAVLTTTEQARVPVVQAIDLVLLKLYAGGLQDGWDIQQLLARDDRKEELIAEVEQLLPELPAHSKKLWLRILES